MHRHGYKGTKFNRQRDQREALLKSLAESLILNESIETTLPKAKAVATYTEKLVTKAKRGQKDLHSRRQVVNSLATLEAAHKLVDELAPKLGGRNSGYFRIEHTALRRGDGSQMARVSFVDKLDSTRKTAEAETKPTAEPAKEGEEEQQISETPKIKDTTSKIAQPKVQAQAPKRSGVRGNR